MQGKIKGNKVAALRPPNFCDDPSIPISLRYPVGHVGTALRHRYGRRCKSATGDCHAKHP